MQIISILLILISYTQSIRILLRNIGKLLQQDQLVKVMNRNISSQQASPFLQNLQKIQFLAQFLIISKFGEDSNILTDALILIEAFKFYHKVTNFLSGDQKITDHSSETDYSQTNSQTKSSLKKMSTLIEKIKQKPYQSNNYQQGLFQKLPCGKKIQLVNSCQVPTVLARSSLTFKQIVGEILYLLRPLISIIAIRLFKQKSYVAYLISLVIDLFIVFVLQKSIKVSSKKQAEVLKNRKREIVWRYLFRKPFYDVMKQKALKPALGKIMKQDRLVSRFIMGLFDMQSTITLTL